ncbi:alkyl/aryl-sulfatase [Roseateles sp. PN1]|uniref:alkyl/aryl-sulfatase n=1 Tax=Roseateles sp. PN1 TaxID=3137372 RepID=UPI003139B5DF
MSSCTHRPKLSLALMALSLAACQPKPPEATAQAEVSAQVQQAHAATAKAADLSDPATFADAKRGFIAAPKGQVKNAAGEVIWDYEAFAFVQGAAPATVNPSLWRQALLNNQIGLFKVSEGIWQLRGFDLANITLIEGKTGWIVVDSLTSRETAAAAMAFARQHLGNKPVSALVFTHSHADHFGGALGVLSAEDAKARAVPIVAPAGFMEEATSENLMVGSAMARRSMYMYGSRLPRSANGLVDDGLGKAVAYGQLGILTPTRLVEKADEELVLDGVRFVFHNVPSSEAPSEFTFSLPDLKAFGGAELMSHTLHNLYTLRGAKVRDALKWAAYLDRSLAQVQGAEVVFNQHHWPVWGEAKIRDFITKQRDVYKFIHDQTVHGINAGLNGAEIAETLQLPKALQDHLNVRGYYGTVRHNARAVYQFYMGWFDAHPSNLDALPAQELAQRYVSLAGGPDKALGAAQKAFDAGDFRWAAELLKHLVYSQPKDKAAAELLARTFEQLGYAAESAPWRNFYLTGALELRQGPPEKGTSTAMLMDMLEHTPIERFLEAMAAGINAGKAEGLQLKINLVFSDIQESYVLQLDNSVLHHKQAPPASDANATLTLSKPFFLRMMTGSAGAKDLLLSDQTKISGSTLDLGRFFSLIDKSKGVFPIVTR